MRVNSQKRSANSVRVWGRAFVRQGGEARERRGQSPPSCIPQSGDSGGIRGEVIKLGSGVPRVPLPRADDLVERIVALKADAEARGFGALAYFLEMPRIETQIEADRIAEEHETGKPISDAVWRTTTVRDQWRGSRYCCPRSTLTSSMSRRSR